MQIKRLDKASIDDVKDLFRSVFTGPPWHEVWTEDQLDEYMKDLTEVRNSLVYGLYEEDELVGIAIGKIKHWCEGTEYFIEEFCIRTDMQGKGYGKGFISLIEEELKKMSVDTIYLMTDRSKPAYHFYQKIGFTELPDLTSFYKSF